MITDAGRYRSKWAIATAGPLVRVTFTVRFWKGKRTKQYLQEDTMSPAVIASALRSRSYSGGDHGSSLINAAQNTERLEALPRLFRRVLDADARLSCGGLACADSAD